MVNASTVMNVTLGPPGNGSSHYLVNQHMMLLMLSSVMYSISESLAWNCLLAHWHISP